MATYKGNKINWSTPKGTVEAGRTRGRIEEPEIIGGPSRKKDTRKWCKGKVGQKHDFVTNDRGYARCSKCQKKR